MPRRCRRVRRRAPPTPPWRERSGRIRGWPCLPRWRASRPGEHVVGGAEVDQAAAGAGCILAAVVLLDGGEAVVEEMGEGSVVPVSRMRRATASRLGPPRRPGGRIRSGSAGGPPGKPLVTIRYQLPTEASSKRARMKRATPSAWVKGNGRNRGLFHVSLSGKKRRDQHPGGSACRPGGQGTNFQRPTASAAALSRREEPLLRWIWTCCAAPSGPTRTRRMLRPSSPRRRERGGRRGRVVEIGGVETGFDHGGRRGGHRRSEGAPFARHRDARRRRLAAFRARTGGVGAGWRWGAGAGVFHRPGLGAGRLQGAAGPAGARR